MRIYRYWVIEKGVVHFPGEDKEIRCYGGSNVSEADAVVKAREKIELVQSKISGDRRAFDAYEAEIREEIVRVIDEKAIVTRNRYGAQVLNVQDMMIMDIDRPKMSLWNIFRGRSDARDKAGIVEQVRALSQKTAYRSCGFRIYETRRGIRVIVLGRHFDPQDSATMSMMKEFNCDSLYMLLCRRQACFRARLTPKPGRMKLRGYKVRYPRDANAEAAFRQWLAGYEAASRDYSVCKFLGQIGRGTVPEAVRLHDEITGINLERKLA